MSTTKLVTTAAALCVLMLAMVGPLVLIAGATDAHAATGLISGSVCATSGSIPGLPDAAAANARVVTATASSRGGEQAALIALMTGLAESGLRVLANPNAPSGNAYPHQGLGHDHDSLGIFQQRHGWGTAAQRMDPVASTNLFLARLLALPHWGSQPPWQAAQSVQRSAVADGSNYRTQLPHATRILHVITLDAAKVDCGGSGLGNPPTGAVGRDGLPVGYTVPAQASPAAKAAVSFALAQLGKPYVFGASGPSSYDCSGLTQASWAAAGVRISRVTTTQQVDGTPTVAARLLPGDLVLTPGGDGTIASPGHVGMFLGDGLVVEAPHTGDVVKVVTYASFTAGGVSALRHIG